MKKGKRSSSYFFLLRIGSAGQEEYQIFCYAKRPTEAMQSYGLYGMPEAGKLYRHWADATLNCDKNGVMGYALPLLLINN